MLFSQYTILSVAGVAKRFGIDFTQGLNDKQVATQRKNTEQILS